MGRELQEFMESWLGSDWEEHLIIGGAMAGEGATDDEVDAARERVVALVREQHPELTSKRTGFGMRGSNFESTSAPRP